MLTNTTSQPALGIEKVRKFRFPLPNENEIQKLAEVYKSLCNKVEAEIVSLRKNKEIKRGLMQDLLTGKVRVE